MKVLILTDDRVGPAMAGSALRAWEIGRVLGDAGFEVLVGAAPDSTRPGESGPEIVTRIPWSWADVVVSPPWNLPLEAFLGTHRLVIDGVTPLPAELAAMPATRFTRRRIRTARARLPLVVARADAVLVAGEAQRQWWNHTLRDHRPERPVLDLPFGIQGSAPPMETMDLPGVPRHHRVVLWWGGVWPWLDLDTLLAARAHLSPSPISVVVPTAPRPGSSATRFGRQDLEAAMARHGLHAPQVVPLEAWVPYGERHRVLNRANLLATLHHPGPEARLSFRTRALDGLWSATPLLLSEGGEVSELTRRHGWGGVVTPGDVVGAAAAIEMLVQGPTHDRCRQNLERARPAWTWERLVQPLAEIIPTLEHTERPPLAPALLRSGWALVGPAPGPADR